MSLLTPCQHWNRGLSEPRANRTSGLKPADQLTRIRIKQEGKGHEKEIYAKVS